MRCIGIVGSGGADQFSSVRGARKYSQVSARKYMAGMIVNGTA
jgi:hypothetical protein